MAEWKTDSEHRLLRRQGLHVQRFQRRDARIAQQSGRHVSRQHGAGAQRTQGGQNPYGVAERTALDHVVFPLLAKGMRRKEAEPKALEAMGPP